MKRTCLVLVVGFGVLAAGVGVSAADNYRGPTRVNFDERLIKGQTAKSGSVYIFERQETGISSLVNRQRRFRGRIIKTVFDKSAGERP